MTYDEFEAMHDDLVCDFNAGDISEEVFDNLVEQLQDRWEEECEE